jgi:hypothetical protein
MTLVAIGVNFVKCAKMGVRFWRAAIMTAQNFQQIYQELVLLLKEHNLDWVVEQAASIDEFSPVDRSLLDPTSAPSQVAGSTSQALLTKPAIQPVQVQLLHLIDAVERVVIDTTDMEGALVDFLGETGNQLKMPLTLGFPTDDTDVETLSVPPDRYQAIAELRQFLKTLRQEVISGVD